MLEVAYQITHTDQMARTIADALQTKIHKNHYGISNEDMEASVEFYRLEKGLSVQISKFEQYRPLTIKRLGTEDNNLLVLDFHLNGIAQLKVTDQRIDSKHYNGLTHGAYFASSSVQSYATFPPGFRNEQFHIIMDKTWMRHFFSEEIETVLDKIELAAPFFMFERLPGRLTALMLNVFRSDRNAQFRKSFLHGKTLEMLSLFFQQLEQRGENLGFGVSNYNDVSRLFDLMSYVDDHLGEHLSVKQLCHTIGYSESKLQKLFRAVLGKSVSKEIRQRRMIKALELLATKAYSISEIGHVVGYSNMSHFAKAFKEVHGFLPSAYDGNNP